MSNWKLLDDKTRELAWDFVYDNCCFHPHNSPKFHSEFKKVSVIKLPKPNIYYPINEYFGEGFTKKFSDGLEKKFREIFQVLSKKKGERLYALDWHHDCYSFDPFLPFERDTYPDTWLIPALPNGDHHFFLTKDFKNGIFGDGIHFSISFFW